MKKKVFSALLLAALLQARSRLVRIMMTTSIICRNRSMPTRVALTS